ncbi:hypothetical protein [Bosea sp. TND4EK4]|uniref:hypothetical protein n=1 Tax=Bosea sp. TND4EK4 TaxID=1907408 RepID=UPI000954B73E|nr:hypothetical protein [Bosea sp. TND4EK4]SIR45843.1 hypothetical protein SAMN05880592_12226 [Bosea sp. TND4EK4]
MTDRHPVPEANVENLAERLIEVVDRASDPRQAADMLDEVSELLWLASSLDPAAENQMSRSRYLSQSGRGDLS